MKVEPSGRSTASLERLEPQPPELLKHTASALYFIRCGELGPVLAVDGAGGVAVAHVALTDAIQKCSRSLHRRVLSGGVKPCGVGLKVLTPGCSLKCRPESYSPSIPRAVHELDELEDECKGGHQ